MTLYICTSEPSVDQARIVGYRPGCGDMLLLIQDAVAVPLHGCGVMRAAEDLSMRGRPHITDDAVDTSRIIKLITEHRRVWVL